MTNRMIFVNLPVRDLARSRAFFDGLGFTFNPRFSDEKAACMVVSELGHVMLLQEAFFRTFTPREPCDTSRQSEALVALSCESRAEVDRLLDRAVAAGGVEVHPPTDHGFMYGRAFFDLDGHHWEAIWMDPRAAQG